MKNKKLFLLFMLFILKQVSGQKTLITKIGKGEDSSVTLNEDELERLEKERTRNVVRLAATDQLNSEIITNRTRAYLSCESGEMIVKINFSAPFRGVAYANYDRASNCKFYGDGSKYYEMRIPLKGCGTKQEAPRLFINNIIFRFHRSLELEEDEIKTIICRYPPPLAPPPSDPVAPYIEPVVPAPAMVLTKLSEIELLLIICALLFLTLLLLGIGIGYYCLKRRNIKIVRKKKILTPAPSEITKLSQSTIFDAIKIPRATAHSTESSETLPSDYPSESLSDDEGRRTVVSETSTTRNDHLKNENAVFIPEPYPMDVEKAESISAVPVAKIYKPEIIKKQILTTILSTENIREEDVINTQNRIITQAPQKQSQLIPYQPKLTTQNIEDFYVDNDEKTDIISDTTHNKLVVIPGPKIMVKNIDDLYVTNISETVTTERTLKSREAHFDQSQQPINTQSKVLTSKVPFLPSQPNTNWDISIRNYSATPTREISETYSSEVNQTQMIDETQFKSKSGFDSKSEIVKDLKKEETITESDKLSSFQKFEVFFKILENPPKVDGSNEITTADKNKWQTIIATDEIFRSLITESTTVEEYTQISRDIRYESLFKPRTWQVIIRILTHPDVVKFTSVQTQTSPIKKFKKEQSFDRTHSSSKNKTEDLSRDKQEFQSPLDIKLITEDVNLSQINRDSIWSQSQVESRSERVNFQSSEKVPFIPSRRHHFVERSANISEFIFPQNRPSLFQPTLDSEQKSQLVSSSIHHKSQPCFQAESFGYVRGASVYERAATSEVFMTGTNGRTHDRASTVGDREEIKSVTETDVYDHWLS